MPDKYLTKWLVLLGCILLSSEVRTQGCPASIELVQEWLTTVQEIQSNQRELLLGSEKTLSRFFQVSTKKSVSRFYAEGNPKLIKVNKFNTDINLWKVNSWEIQKCQECESSKGATFYAVYLEMSFTPSRARTEESARLVIDVSDSGLIMAIGRENDLLGPNQKCDEKLIALPSAPPPSSEIPTRTLPPIAQRNSEDQEQIEALKKQLRTKDRELVEARTENSNLVSEITRNTRTIDSLTEANRHLTDTLVELRSIRDCIVELDNERKRRRIEARKELDQANELYEAFKRDYLSAFKGNISEDELTQKIVSAWNIYEKYLNSSCCVDTNCGQYPITFCDDHRNAQDHLNVALILTYFPKYVESSFEEQSSLCQKVSRMNEIILVELSQAIKKTNELESTDYTLRADMERVIHLLPYSLSPESRCDENATFRSTEVWQRISQIKPAYDRGDYMTSIYLYNRYQRFFEFEEIKDQKKELDEAKFAAAAILLWDLGNVSRAEELFTQSTQKKSVPAFVAQDVSKSKISSYPGNWLADFFDVRKEIASKMLETLANDPETDQELRKEAFILLSKRHHKQARK